MVSSLSLSAVSLPEWSLVFAKEPAPGESTQSINMDKTVVLGPPGKSDGPKPPSSKERILFMVLVIVIAAGGGYLAMNPDLLMGLMGDAPGEAPPMPAPRPKPKAPAPAPQAAAPAAPVVAAPAPPVVAAPAPAAPAPVAAPAAAPAAAPSAIPTPVTPAVPLPAPTAPAAAPKPAVPAPVAVASVPVPAASAPAPAPAAIPSPKFGEGQKVSVGAPTPLMADSAGTKASPTTAKPGSPLVIVDADLQNNAWVYAVRTDKGATGWVAEKNLKAK
jgi:hypothetical protein